jgi:hypothetical protein
MKQVTLTCLGSQLGAVMPVDYIRALGWARGDKLTCYIQGANIVFRNNTERAARFTRAFRKRLANTIDSDNR